MFCDRIRELPGRLYSFVLHPLRLEEDFDEPLVVMVRSRSSGGRGAPGTPRGSRTRARGGHTPPRPPNLSERPGAARGAIARGSSLRQWGMGEQSRRRTQGTGALELAPCLFLSRQAPGSQAHTA